MSMRVKLTIKAPPKQANKMEALAKQVIKVKDEWLIKRTSNKDNSEVVWMIECPYAKLTKIIKNVSKYNYLLLALYDSMAMKHILAKVTEEEREQLIKMSQEGITIEYEGATEGETLENLTWRDKLKGFFNRK
jgi:hypothetical protein